MFVTSGGQKPKKARLSTLDLYALVESQAYKLTCTCIYIFVNIGVYIDIHIHVYTCGMGIHMNVCIRTHVGLCATV